MQASNTPTQPSKLDVVVALARLLERIDGQHGTVSPEQYRAVAQHLSSTLAETPPSAALDQVLRALPAAAELYENLHYSHSGLCRSPLEAAMAAEQQAASSLQRIAQGARSQG